MYHYPGYPSAILLPNEFPWKYTACCGWRTSCFWFNCVSVCYIVYVFGEAQGSFVYGDYLVKFDHVDLGISIKCTLPTQAAPHRKSTMDPHWFRCWHYFFLASLSSSIIWCVLPSTGWKVDNILLFHRYSYWAASCCSIDKNLQCLVYTV